MGDRLVCGVTQIQPRRLNITNSTTEVITLSRALVTGWYGQNVPYPGFSQVSGVVTSALLSVITSVVLFVMFKRRGWI